MLKYSEKYEEAPNFYEKKAFFGKMQLNDVLYNLGINRGVKTIGFYMVAMETAHTQMTGLQKAFISKGDKMYVFCN